MCLCVSAEGQRCGEAGWSDITRLQRVCAGDRVRASNTRQRHRFQVLNVVQIMITRSLFYTPGFFFSSRFFLNLEYQVVYKKRKTVPYVAVYLCI